MRFASAALSASFVCALLVACSHASPPSPSAAGAGSSTAITPDTAVLAAPSASAVAVADPTPVADAGMSMGSAANGADASTDFAACSADSDCVAVKKNACCNHGELEAVAASSADAYKASFTCPPPRPKCPMFLRLDSRVAVCDSATQHCAMVAPTTIACGGSGGHSCPSGTHCGAGNKCTK